MLAACLATLGPDPTLGYTQTQPIRTTSSTTRRRHQDTLSHADRTLSKRQFRVEGEGLPFLPPASTSTVLEKNINIHHNINIDMMPVWLKQQNGFEIITLFENLKGAMTNSYMTEDEADAVIAAIKSAAKGDSDKMAGVTQLCLILVETMDMGFEVLISAVIHYFSCVDARERNAILTRFSSESQSSMLKRKRPVVHSYLWDIISSCSTVQQRDIVNSFGIGVTTIVEDAASLKSAEMKAESIMQTSDAENLRRLLVSETGDWRALAIRSAAALFRLRAVEEKKDQQMSLTAEEVRVAKEALHTYAPLASTLGVRRLKEELERAAFRVLYRRQYDKVSSLIHQPRTKGTTTNIKDGLISIERDVSEQIRHLLKNDCMFERYANNIVVSARIKEPFSLWRKMIKLGVKNVLEVPDALALRIIFDGKKQCLNEDIKVTHARERALCYYVKKLCTDRWRPDSTNPRFKDYIEKPKTNGYQSLHYTANTECNGNDWLFEVQIRSGDMHRVAEYGLAAHWDYKLQGNDSNGSKDITNSYQLDHSSDAYLKSVQAWHWQHAFTNRNPDTFCANGNNKHVKTSEKARARAERLAPYIKNLSSVRSRLTRNQVMVFLSPSEGSTRYFDGKILALPSGSCVLDALKEGEKLYGITTNFMGFGIVQNGNQANLTQRLNNGDVLKVPATSGRNVFSV